MKYNFQVQVTVLPSTITVMSPIGWDYAEWDSIMETLGIDQERVYFADYIRHPYGELVTLERDRDRVEDTTQSLEQLSDDYFFSVSGEVPADPRGTG